MQKAYQTKLLKLRTAAVAKTIEGLNEVGIDQMENHIRVSLNEPYLSSFVEKLNKNIAYHFGELQLEKMSNVYGVKSKPQWKRAVDEWVKTSLATKVTSMNGALIEEMTLWLADAIANFDDNTQSVQATTKMITAALRENYSNVATWQVRRIVHTETLSAAALGQFESVKAMNRDTTKTWVVTGLRTRADHLAMNGTTVDMDDYFILPNGDQMLFPRDSSMGAGASNIVNCACGVIYALKN